MASSITAFLTDILLLFLSFQVFFVLINNEGEALHDAAITVASITELALYGITTAAVVVGMIQGWMTENFYWRTCWFGSIF